MGPAANRAHFGEQPKQAYAVSSINRPGDFNGWQVQEPDRPRADPENVFDELKQAWGFRGFCAKSRAPPEPVAPSSSGLINRGRSLCAWTSPKHTGAKRSRRGVFLITAGIVQSDRRKDIWVSMNGGWAQPRRGGPLRFPERIRAPPLRRD